MEWQDEEARQPWESGGDLPWQRDEAESGWLATDPEAWRGGAPEPPLVWPEFASGSEVWPLDDDDE